MVHRVGCATELVPLASKVLGKAAMAAALTCPSLQVVLHRDRYQGEGHATTARLNGPAVAAVGVFLSAMALLLIIVEDDSLRLSRSKTPALINLGRTNHLP